MLSAGAKAPSFTLADLQGNQRSLMQVLERGPVLLAIYKISCPTCQLTMPYLQRITAASIANPLQVVAISQDGEIGTARFMETYGLSMPTLLDREEDGYAVSNAFGITHVPSLFLVEQDRTISLASAGFNRHDLEAIGQRALGGSLFRQEDHVPEWKAG
jgi:peroxiredoxin